MLTLAPQLRTLKPPSTVLRLGQSRADPKQESPGADSRGTYCSSLDFTGMEVVQDLAELGLPTLEQATSCHRGSGKCGLSTH